MLTSYFDKHIKPAADHLAFLMGGVDESHYRDVFGDEPSPPTEWRDAQGITHIHVLDTDKRLELVNGEWVERPF